MSPAALQDSENQKNRGTLCLSLLLTSSRSCLHAVCPSKGHQRASSTLPQVWLCVRFSADFFGKGNWWLERSPVWAMISVLLSCLVVNARFFTSQIMYSSSLLGGISTSVPMPIQLGGITDFSLWWATLFCTGLWSPSRCCDPSSWSPTATASGTLEHLEPKGARSGL